MYFACIQCAIILIVLTSYKSKTIIYVRSYYSYWISNIWNKEKFYVHYSYVYIPYNGLSSRGANFHECCTSDLNRNFHNSEIYDPELM